MKKGEWEYARSLRQEERELFWGDSRGLKKDMWEVHEMGVRGMTFRKLVWETGEGESLKCALFGPLELQTLSSICWAATTCWAEVIWLKVSVVWCSPNVQSRLWGAEPSFLTWWRAQLGNFPRRSSAPQDLQSAFWQIYALIVVPHPFCSGFSFSTKTNTPQDCTKASHSLWWALDFAVLLPKCAARLRATGDVWEGGSCFQRFPRTDAG